MWQRRDSSHTNSWSNNNHHKHNDNRLRNSKKYQGQTEGNYWRNGPCAMMESQEELCWERKATLARTDEVPQA